MKNTLHKTEAPASVMAAHLAQSPEKQPTRRLHGKIGATRKALDALLPAAALPVVAGKVARPVADMESKAPKNKILGKIKIHGQISLSDRLMRGVGAMIYFALGAIPIVFVLRVIDLVYPGKSIWQALILAFEGHASTTYAWALALALPIFCIPALFRSMEFLHRTIRPSAGNPWRLLPRGILLFVKILVALPGLGIMVWYAPTIVPAALSVIAGHASAIESLTPLCVGFAFLAIGRGMLVSAMERQEEDDDRWDSGTPANLIPGYIGIDPYPRRSDW